MSLRHVMADDTIHDHAVVDDGDASILDEERLADELAGVVELAAAFLAFLASANGLASDFAAFTCGTYSLEELRADLWCLAAWIRGNA